MGQNNNQKLTEGAYYVNFPEYDVMSSESSADGKDGGRAKLGHAGVLLVDNNGRTRYYEYGRYNNGFGTILKEDDGSSDGNWRRVTVPDSPTLEQMGIRLLGTSPHAGNTVRLTRVPADNNKIIQYITQSANDKNRGSYQVCGYNDKNCGEEAWRAISEGQNTGFFRNAANGTVSFLQRLGQLATDLLPGENLITTRGRNNTDMVGPLAIFSGRDTPQDYEDKFITYPTYVYSKSK